MYSPAQLAPRPTTAGTGAERELGTGEFSSVGSLPPARGQRAALPPHPGRLLAGATPASGAEKDSAGRGAGMDVSLLQAPNWKMLKASPLSEQGGF